MCLRADVKFENLAIFCICSCIDVIDNCSIRVARFDHALVPGQIGSSAIINSYASAYHRLLSFSPTFHHHHHLLVYFL